MKQETSVVMLIIKFTTIVITIIMTIIVTIIIITIIPMTYLYTRSRSRDSISNIFTSISKSERAVGLRIVIVSRRCVHKH